MLRISEIDFAAMASTNLVVDTGDYEAQTVFEEQHPLSAYFCDKQFSFAEPFGEIISKVLAIVSPFNQKESRLIYSITCFDTDGNKVNSKQMVIDLSIRKYESDSDFKHRVNSSLDGLIMEKVQDLCVKKRKNVPCSSAMYVRLETITIRHVIMHILMLQ